MNRKAFTLTEILVALTILSVIASILYYAFKKGLDAWWHARQKLEIYQSARAIIGLASRDLASAIAVEGQNAFYGGPHEMTFTAIVEGELREATFAISGYTFSISYDDCDYKFGSTGSAGSDSEGFLYWGSATTSWEDGVGETAAESYWTTTGTADGDARSVLPKAVRARFPVATSSMDFVEEFEFIVYLPNSE